MLLLCLFAALLHLLLPISYIALQLVQRCQASDFLRHLAAGKSRLDLLLAVLTECCPLQSVWIMGRCENLGVEVLRGLQRLMPSVLKRGLRRQRPRIREQLFVDFVLGDIGSFILAHVLDEYVEQEDLRFLLLQQLLFGCELA